MLLALRVSPNLCPFLYVFVSFQWMIPRLPRNWHNDRKNVSRHICMVHHGYYDFWPISKHLNYVCTLSSLRILRMDVGFMTLQCDRGKSSNNKKYSNYPSFESIELHRIVVYKRPPFIRLMIYAQMITRDSIRWTAKYNSFHATTMQIMTTHYFLWLSAVPPTHNFKCVWL